MSAPDPTVALNPSAIIRVGSRDTDPMIGREVIGQYRIEKKIGVGGMGAVYLAQQTSVSRPAVIKVLRSQIGGSSEDGTARFAVEAKAASSLNHPNIVTIYNYGEMEDGTLFLAMEYIAGETLAQRLDRCGQLPADRAVRIAAQIASALGEAHAHGVVHRDLKPANVMLVERAGEPDFVKVLDFGIAKIDNAGVTSAGYVVGTPRYMSPEQLLGKQIDCRSDIYSAAVVLYEMLAGVTPFQSETPMGWMHQHVEVPPKPPSALTKGSKIPAPIESVVLRALAKARADRPSSMEMFALDLVAALNAPTEPPPPPWWRRAAVRAAQLVVVVLIALVSGAWRFLRTVGSGTWRVVRAIGSGMRGLVRAIGSGTWLFLRTIGSGTWRCVRAIGSGTRRFARALGSGTWKALRAIGKAPRRSPSADGLVVRRPAPTPVRLSTIPRERSAAWMLATPARRLLIALLVVLATAGLLVALFPEVRADFGLGDKPSVGKAKRQPAPAPARPRDKAR
jgi:serine/threonine-protein kinase